MAEIIQFGDHFQPKREEPKSHDRTYVLACKCGCQRFKIYPDGVVECSDCQEIKNCVYASLDPALNAQDYEKGKKT